MLGKAAKDTLATACFVAGLFLGIYFLTGTSIDPTDIMGMVAQTITDQLAPQYSILVAAFLGVVAIIGVWQTFKLVTSGSKDGILGLVMTLCCFFGGMVLVFNPVVGIILLLVGYAIANLT